LVERLVPREAAMLKVVDEEWRHFGMTAWKGKAEPSVGLVRVQWLPRWSTSVAPVWCYARHGWHAQEAA
jgi:hypothetical protein